MGFIDFLVRPLFEAWSLFSSNKTTEEMLANAVSNRAYWASTVDTPNVHPVFTKTDSNLLKMDPFDFPEKRQNQTQPKLRAFIMQNKGKMIPGDAGGLKLPLINPVRRNSSLNDLINPKAKFKISIVDDEPLPQRATIRRRESKQPGVYSSNSQLGTAFRRPTLTSNDKLLASNYAPGMPANSRSKLSGSQMVLNSKRTTSSGPSNNFRSKENLVK
jgi:hypothetical protein